MIHTLKIQQRYYERLRDGEKKCEIRKNDRDFQVGDKINLKVFEDETEEFWADEEFLITHVLTFPEGLKDGYVALSIELVLKNS